MVRTIGRYSGLNVAEPVYGFLTESYGGHPFLIRLACSEVWRAGDVKQPDKRHSVTTDSFEQARSAIRTRLEQPVKDILLSLVWWYPEEYELLRILADGDADFVAQYLAGGDKSSILKFANYGLLKDDGKRFAISDLRDFLREYGQAYKKELSPFTRGDIPPQYLPEIPDLGALARLFEKRTEVEGQLRRAILLYLGVRHTWDNAKIAKSMQAGIHRKGDPSAAKDLFVGRSPQEVINDLYTLDLKTIILASWDVFGPLFENKSRFEMNMDTLNKARRIDAHAKPVTQNEADEIIDSYGWLRQRLSAIPALGA